MSDDAEKSAVRITVPPRSAESETDSLLQRGPVVRTPAYTVVVSIAGDLLETEIGDLHETEMGLNVRRVLQTAVALAADNDGRVLLLGVVSVANDAALETVREYVESGQSSDSDPSGVVEFVVERRTWLAQVTSITEDVTPDVPVRAVIRPVTDATQGAL